MFDQIETENIEVNYQVWPQITLEETKSAIKKASNWKRPGKDGIANFCIKNLPSLHQDLTNAYNDCICNPETCPDWLRIGITYLLPKTKTPKIQKIIVQSRLPTTYKILTSIITERVYKHLDEKNLHPKEQKGCRRGSYGCEDQLLINKAIIEEAKKKKITIRHLILFPTTGY